MRVTWNPPHGLLTASMPPTQMMWVMGQVQSTPPPHASLAQDLEKLDEETQRELQDLTAATYQPGKPAGR